LRNVWKAYNLRSSSTLVLGLRELDLYAVDAVHAVDEEDEDEDKRNLSNVSSVPLNRTARRPYL
jgi:hypothetical protein